MNFRHFPIKNSFHWVCSYKSLPHSKFLRWFVCFLSQNALNYTPTRRKLYFHMFQVRDDSSFSAFKHQAVAILVMVLWWRTDRLVCSTVLTVTFWLGVVFFGALSVSHTSTQTHTQRSSLCCDCFGFQSTFRHSSVRFIIASIQARIIVVLCFCEEKTCLSVFIKFKNCKFQKLPTVFCFDSSSFGYWELYWKVVCYVWDKCDLVVSFCVKSMSKSGFNQFFFSLQRIHQSIWIIAIFFLLASLLLSGRHTLRIIISYWFFAVRT